MPSPFGDILQHEIETAAAAFLEKKRPTEVQRNELDLGYRTDGLSVYVIELRPSFSPPHEMQEEPVAKTTFVKSKGAWKVYWMRADLKWHAYPKMPEVKSIRKFFDVVDADEYNCFFG